MVKNFIPLHALSLVSQLNLASLATISTQSSIVQNEHNIFIGPLNQIQGISVTLNHSWKLTLLT